MTTTTITTDEREVDHLNLHSYIDSLVEDTEYFAKHGVSVENGTTKSQVYNFVVGRFNRREDLLAEKDAEIERLKGQLRISRDKLETAEDTIKRLQLNQIPDMGELSHNARAAFYKSILPKRLIEAWQGANEVLDSKGGDWKAALTRVYERLDDILDEFELFRR